MLDEIQVEITKTSDGLHDYIQIRSPAAIPVNIVLVAGRIVVSDRRPAPSLSIAAMNRLASEKKAKK